MQPKPRDGDRKTVREFVIIPTRIGDNTRVWWEWIEVDYVFIESWGFDGWARRERRVI